MRNISSGNPNRNDHPAGALRKGLLSYGYPGPNDATGVLREDFCFYSLDLQKTGEKLHCFLSRSGYTVRELSHMIGVSNQTIYKWFHGDALPSLNNLYQLSRLFGCSMDELVAGGGVCRYDMPDLYMRESAVTQSPACEPATRDTARISLPAGSSVMH